MIDKRLLAAVSGVGLLVTGLAAPAAQAREPRDIYAPIFAQYKSITDARKKLRRKEKKGQPMSGDEYFAMAHACQYEEPASASKILTALSRSGCKDKAVDYFIEAGMRGTPEGFLGAAQKIGTGQATYMYAQMAYQLADTDTALRNDAAAEMAKLRPTAGDIIRVNAQAQSTVQQLLAANRYQTATPGATEGQLASVAPQLKWLDFKNPKRCTWSDAAQKVLQNSYAFDDRRNLPTIPAKVRVPGVKNWVTSRIIRPGGNSSNEIDIYTDFKGNWNGLTVLGLRYSFLEESDGYQATGIRFAEPVKTVAARLAASGFVVNADGSYREQVDKVDTFKYRDERGRQQTSRNIDGVITSVARKNGETLFLCDEVFYASYGA
ncbi:hypothetical protein [Pontixanthobacter aquaemixtae]|uniref:Uncharacterized protein n=1 Tax=Pontixanthobacter aquaemixtae TaxID=1958940 RepID=A0A844ZSA3_9SPHN|nr:hypothetical protein [Pontixanthobacter aquaemixtae]MXO90735.1 hypothetical protein [Pontixanthobacter aquaemixtae]